MKFVWWVDKDGDNFAVPEGIEPVFLNCVIAIQDSEDAPVFYPTVTSVTSTYAPDFPPDLTLDEKKAWCEAQWILMR